MYLFTNDDAAADRVIERTRSGGKDDQPHDAPRRRARPALRRCRRQWHRCLPRQGGVDTFSHRRSVLAKPTRPDVPGVLYPPYKRWKEAILRRML